MSDTEALAQPEQEPLSNEEISAWADRHDIQGTPLSLRCMVEDAASLRPALYTPPPAQQEPVFDCPRCGHCCSLPDPMPLFDDWPGGFKHD